MAKKKKPARKKREYRAAPHSPITDDDAALIGAEIEAIKARKGVAVVSADELVASARRKSSKIHHLFEWKVEVAAEAHWRYRATQLLSYVVYEVEIKKRRRTVRSFHNIEWTVSDDEVKRGYVDADDARADEELSTQIVQRARGELRRWHKRYGLYRAYFQGIYDELDNFFDGEFR